MSVKSGIGFALFVTVIVSAVQMFTVSGTGILGCIMNIISSCSFACTAAFIYKRKHKVSSAILGLFCGCACQVAVMLLWNYLTHPSTRVNRWVAYIKGLINCKGIFYLRKSLLL